MAIEARFDVVAGLSDGRALRIARREAFGADQYVGQKGLTTKDEIQRLALLANVAGGSLTLELCSESDDVAVFIAELLGCTVVGVPHAGTLPFGDRSVSTVFMLEAMSSLAHPKLVIAEASRVLARAGRLVFTVDVGQPLRADERRLPGDDSLRLLRGGEPLRLLHECGLAPLHMCDLTAAHAEVAERLAAAYLQYWDALAMELGVERTGTLVATHQRWATWLRTDRVRKLGIIAVRP